ncbi:MAG: hypothetical protein M3Y93_13105 [Pseudomonadota bacterium]|nr:hypothetical protein [Pseudomonadota bacterium]
MSHLLTMMLRISAASAASVELCYRPVLAIASCRYKSSWHEMANIPGFDLRKSTRLTTSYRPNRDGTLRALTSCNT